MIGEGADRGKGEGIAGAGGHFTIRSAVGASHGVVRAVIVGPGNGTAFFDGQSGRRK